MTKPVMVTTSHRGVFFGYLGGNQDENAKTLKLTGAKMAIRFGTVDGVMQLANTGPTNHSKIGAPADVTLHDITAVFDVTKEAEDAWNGR